jgi:hypothetical protein
MAALLASAGAQTTWNESGDAGDLPGTAQVVLGGGPLTAITGVISSSTDVDMFQIYICDPVNFKAWTSSPRVNTQLWLFDDQGRALWHNDNPPTGAPVTLGSGQSYIGPGASPVSYHLSSADNSDQLGPGTTTWSLPGEGIYYIAISARDRDPRDAGGGFVIYSGPPEAHIFQSNPADPDRVVAYWTGNGQQTGAYTIYFEGACFVPEPASMMALGVGLAGLIGLRRRKR